MNISSLSDISPIELLTTFNKAFSDYQIDVEESLHEFFVGNIQRGIDYSASFGFFSDEKELLGFIFCGVRINMGRLQFYDGATGVIPSHRGQGIASRLLDRALQEAKVRGADSFILEVLQQNQKAQKLYEAQGFSISRTLRCFEKKKENIAKEKGIEMVFKSPEIRDFFGLYEKLKPNYTPSWQNSFSSIVAIFDLLTTKVLYHYDKAIGYIVFNSLKGGIFQIAALDDDPSILKLLISHAASFTVASSMKLINIEESSPLISFLEGNEWAPLVDQFEMIRYLNT